MSNDPGFLIFCLIIGFALLLNGLWGLFLGKVRIRQMSWFSEENITIEGRWAAITSLSYMVMGLVFMAAGVFTDESYFYPELFCAFIALMVMMWLVMWMAVNNGTIARD